MNLLSNRGAFAKACVVLLALAAASAFAQEVAAPSVGVLNQIQDAYAPYQTRWHNSIKTTAMGLFWILVLIDFSWTAVTRVLSEGLSIDSLVHGLGKQILRYGFFFALLKFSDTWLPALIDSFRRIGANASGLASVSPDAIVDLGMDVAMGIVKQLGDQGLTDKMMLAVPMMLWALIIFCCFVFVAMQVLITNIEIYLVCGAGVILLGMGGSMWTKDMAVNVYKYAVQVGVKLMILTLVIGVGQSVMSTLTIDPNNFIRSAMAAGGAVLTFAYLSIKAPALANGMISGSSSLSAGDMAGAAIGIGAGVAAAGAGAVAAGSMAKSGAAAMGAGAGQALAGGAGIAQAIGAGMNSAADFGKTGMSAATHAMGEVAQHGIGLGKAAVGGAVDGAAGGFKENVAASTGGKIAESIQASRGGSISAAGSGASSEPGATGAVGSSAGSGPSLAHSLGAPGNAAGASLESGQSGGATGNSSGGGSGSSGRSLQDGIRGMNDFVPDDQAQAAHVAISTDAQVK